MTFKTCFYDIETGLSLVELFSLGEQTIRHGQLLQSSKVTPILCISYAINDAKPKTLVTGPGVFDSKEAIMEFDSIIASCDVIVGKNNHRFDNKHINTHRLFNQLPGMPHWRSKSDDLESQLRRNFHMLSQSLDAISHILGLGGKQKMDFKDWQDIKHYRDVQQAIAKYGKDGAKAVADILYHAKVDDIIRDGKKAELKMQEYNRKDVDDTREIWNYAKAHFEPKFNRATSGIMCKNCGSTHVRKNGSQVNKAGTSFQNFYCEDHKGFAGKATLKTNGTYGKVT